MSDKPVCIADFEEYAKTFLPKSVYDYYRSGADDQETLADNVAAFSRWKLYPRVLRDVSVMDLSSRVLGQSVAVPVCVAATAMQRMAHPHGETATARACQAVGTGMMLSSWATSSIEEVAAAAPSGLRWLQLYAYKERQVTASLVRRAERAGYRGIFLTVDTPYLGRRLADVRNRFRLPPHLRYGCCGRGRRWGTALGSSAVSAGLASALGGNKAFLALCKLGKVQGEAAEVRDVGCCCVLVSMGSWLSSNLSWAEPCCDVELGSKRGLDFVAKTAFQKMLWFLLLSHDCSGSRAVLLPTAEPLFEQLQLFFYSNTEMHGYQSFSSFTPIQKHIGISLPKFCVKATVTPQCVLGCFLCLRICDIMIDFSTNSIPSPLQGQ
ncbi:hydroxyacid oxidase 1 isoform X1 [Onychostruthus taczanowskii]|uniref:hydroxyacid oxidase 1 isoform X1 n=1 Tax=Onychostruthus taczanowskii TaxID=356909 RepID=UPI001B7FFF0E|nr:hydroxyacid oxidase 1 isoform X1 [Onychostruthus taczanowskii]